MYIITLPGFVNDSMYLCTSIKQYSFQDRPLFSYENYIEIKRNVTKEEAELLYDIIDARTSLSGGKAIKIIKLQ